MTVRLLLLVAAVVASTGCRPEDRSRAPAPTTQVGAPVRELFERGVAHMEAGAAAYDQAIEAFREALRQAPDLWEASLNIGIIELRRARLSAAAEAFEQSITVYASPEALEGLGEVYLRQNRPKQAVELYEQALARTPGDVGLRIRLAVSLRHAGRLDAAEAELRAVLGQHAGNPVAYASLAAIQMDREQYDLAELILNKGLSRNPDHPALLTNLGLVALRRGDDQTAFMLFEKASQADPGFLTGRLNKAAVYLGAGDHTRAAEELEYVLQVEPGNAEALLGLGVARRLAGDHAAARQSWERVLELDPNNAAAHFNLAVLAMDFTEQPAVARKHLERYLQLAPEEDPRREAVEERIALLQALQRSSK